MRRQRAWQVAQGQRLERLSRRGVSPGPEWAEAVALDESEAPLLAFALDAARRGPGGR